MELKCFRDWDWRYDEQYAIIGGTAYDLLMTDGSLDFRAAKDINLVLIVEAVDVQIASRSWEYVIEAGYEHRKKALIFHASDSLPDEQLIESKKGHKEWPLVVVWAGDGGPFLSAAVLTDEMNDLGVSTDADCGN